VPGSLPRRTKPEARLEAPPQGVSLNEGRNDRIVASGPFMSAFDRVVEISLARRIEI
jgi:hypothetical protein